MYFWFYFRFMTTRLIPQLLQASKENYLNEKRKKRKNKRKPLKQKAKKMSPQLKTVLQNTCTQKCLRQVLPEQFQIQKLLCDEEGNKNWRRNCNSLEVQMEAQTQVRRVFLDKMLGAYNFIFPHTNIYHIITYWTCTYMS